MSEVHPPVVSRSNAMVCPAFGRESRNESMSNAPMSSIAAADRTGYRAADRKIFTGRYERGRAQHVFSNCARLVVVALTEIGIVRLVGFVHWLSGSMIIPMR